MPGREGSGMRHYSDTVESLERRYLLAGLVPDPTFGTQGDSKLAFGTIYDSVVLVDQVAGGKILAAGTHDSHAVLTRMKANGSLDTSFGDKGLITTPQAGFTEGIVQPDGKILLAGDSALSRFNEDG